MTDLDIFTPHILPFVTGCPDSTVRLAVLEAAIELCERSGVWQASLPLVGAGPQLFMPVLPAGARIMLIKDVMCSPMRELPAGAYEVSGDWTTISFREPQVAAIADSFTVKASLAPTRITNGRPTGELPDVLVERFLNGICAGAKQRLMVMPGQGWTNLELASYFQQEFKQACGTAAAEALHGRAANSPRVQYRRFG